MSIELEKQAMRAAMRELRASILDSEVQAEAASHHAFAYIDSSRAQLVALYHPLSSELSTFPLAERLWRDGRIVALPVVSALHQPMIFKRWQKRDELVKGKCGTLEPAAEAETLTPDLIFAPLLAFDRKGYRLGMGGGYYDRTCAELALAHPQTRFIGYGYSAQEVTEVPHEAFDIPLHGVVTERGFLVTAFAG